MVEFFHRQLDYVYYVYGLPFIVAAVICILLTRRRHNAAIPWGWFGAFLSIHGINEWLDMAAFSVADAPSFKALRLCFMGVSFICLVEFGRLGMHRLRGRGIGPWVLALLFLPAALGSLAGLSGLNAAVRYAFGFVGAVWAARVLWHYGACAFPSGPASPKALRAAAVALALYAAASGIVVPPASFPPAQWLNQEAFFTTFGFPIQLVRAFLAGVVGIAVWREYCAERSRESLPYERASQFRFEMQTLTLVSLIIAGGWIGVEFVGRAEDAHMREEVLHQTFPSAMAVDPALVAALHWNEKDLDNPAYHRLKQLMTSLCKSDPHIRFVSLVGIRDRKSYILVDSEPPESPLYSPPGESYDEHNPIDQARQIAGESFVSKPARDRWGKWVTGSVPISGLDPKYGIVSIALDFHSDVWNLSVERARLPFILVNMGMVGVVLFFTLAQQHIREEKSEQARYLDRIRRQQRAIVQLATSHAVNAGGLLNALGEVTEAGAEALACEHVGVWLRDSDSGDFRCLDMYSISPNAHTTEATGNAVQYPTFYAKLALGRTFCVDNVVLDPGTDELRRDYLDRLDIRAMLASPIRISGRLAGFVCFGHAGSVRTWQPDEIRFAGEIADQVSQILVNGERRAAEEQLRQSAEALTIANRNLEHLAQAAETATRLKSEFLANMSHEIRTPITAILGYSDLLLDRPPDATAQEYLAVLKRNGEHLLALINDILDLSKIEAGELIIDAVPTSLSRLIDDVRHATHLRAKHKGLALDFQILDGIPDRIVTDPIRLRQILINVVGNAVKFTESGGIRITVGLSEGPSPQARFDVIDTGIGMTPEQVARVFLPFSQADGSMTRRFGGTGLGLSISLRLARALGGDLEIVESRPGVGTHFRVTVDAGATEEAAVPYDEETQFPVATPAQATTRQRLTGSILLAEDGPDNQRLISTVLRKAGADVTLVDNGRSALEAVAAAERQGTPYRVVLMDMQMPVVDGYEAARTLRERGCRTPIIALTAHAMAEDRRKCLDAGCDHYISKPLNLADFTATVALYCSEETTEKAPAANDAAETNA